MLTSKLNCFRVKSVQLISVKFMQTNVPLSVTNREARFLTKVMQGSKKSKKRTWYKENERENALANTISPTDLGVLGGGRLNVRRQNVLNKLYMQHITDQMASDELVIGKGIQVTKIKVSPDFKAINVYWLCDSSIPSGSQLPTLLHNYSFTLRHNLSQLNAMGSVPPITFLPDKQLAQGVNVDRLLAKADLGDDGEFFFQDLTSNLPDSQSQDCLPCTEILPPMRHDVLGLDQAEILSHVRRNVKKISSKLSKDTATENLRNIESVIAEFDQHDRKNLSHQLKTLKIRTKDRKSDRHSPAIVHLNNRDHVEDEAEFDQDFPDDDFDQVIK